MAELEMLDAAAHAGLRIATDNARGRHFVQIVASEFMAAMQDYPIFFTKHPQTGAFYAGAVMGLESGENLLAEDGRLPGYRPADLVRQGFFIDEQAIAIDRHDPVFSPDGEPLFDINGEPAAALRRVQQAMQVLNEGLPATEAIISRLLEHRVIEPIDISLRFDDGGTLTLDGLYALSLDRLHALPDDAALDLFRRGDLQIAYAQSASMQHVRRLARIRNERLFAAVP